MREKTYRIALGGVLTALAAVLVLLVFFLKDILIPFIRLELNNDFEGAKALLLERGVLEIGRAHV